MPLTSYCTLVELCILLHFIYPQCSDLCRCTKDIETECVERLLAIVDGRWCQGGRKGEGEGGQRARRGKRGRFLGVREEGDDGCGLLYTD